jgi:transcriptional regulator ATRX
MKIFSDHCMMQFVKPNFLGNRKEFTNRFVNPIKEGQHKESTAMQVRFMKKRACVLHKMLEPSVQVHTSFDHVLD